VVKNRDITARTFAFAVNIVKLAEGISSKRPSCSVLLKQVIRSGTSIGANVEEAQAAESKADFRHKYSVALKEARETKYWLKLLAGSELVREEQLTGLRQEADEISRIIGKIIINSRKGE
jgi:four helix bundle protein